VNYNAWTTHEKYATDFVDVYMGFLFWMAINFDKK